jgi:hypothetical protein
MTKSIQEKCPLGLIHNFPTGYKLRMHVGILKTSLD